MQTKRFVKQFYFGKPDFGQLPEGFPRVKNKGLTRQEGHLLDGIKLAWLASEGRGYLVSKVVKRTAVAFVIIFVLLAGGSLVGKNQGTTKEVSAKTVGRVVGGVVEATMSAVFR